MKTAENNSWDQANKARYGKKEASHAGKLLMTPFCLPLLLYIEQCKLCTLYSLLIFSYSFFFLPFFPLRSLDCPYLPTFSTPPFCLLHIVLLFFKISFSLTLSPPPHSLSRLCTGSMWGIVSEDYPSSLLGQAGFAICNYIAKSCTRTSQAQHSPLPLLLSPPPIRI